VVSVAFGLALVVFAISLNEGAYAQLVDDAVRMQSGHLTYENPAYRDAPAIDLVIDDTAALRSRVEEVDGVAGTKLLVLGQGMARSGSGAVGVAVMGIEPAAEIDASPLARNLVAGAYLDPADEGRIVLGAALAHRLELEVGKKLVLASNDVAGDLVESLFRVKGIFKTGSDEIDGYLVQAPIAAVRDFYGLRPDQATQLGVLLEDTNQQDGVLAALSQIGGNSAVVHRWQEVLPELNAFIRLDRVSDWTFEGMLLVLVLFTIFNTLLMSVVERERELAVLLAIGTPTIQLRVQVLVEAVFIGAMGCGLGIAIGIAIALYFQINGLDMSGVFGEGVTVSGLAMSPRIFAKINTQFISIVGLLVFTAIIVLGGIVTRRVARTSLVDVLR